MTGLDGAGKSTVVARLAQELERDGLSPAVSTIWDPIFDPAFEGRALFARPAEADGYLELLDSTSRMLFLAHGLRESLARCLARAADVVVLNAYWYKYLATEVAHGGEREALRRIASIFPEPDLTFHLRVGPAEAARRKQAFSAYETGFDPARSASAFEAFQAVALRELEALASELGWVEVPTEGVHAGEPAERVVAEVRRRVAAHRRRAT